MTFSARLARTNPGSPSSGAAQAAKVGPVPLGSRYRRHDGRKTASRPSQRLDPSFTKAAEEKVRSPTGPSCQR